MGFTLYKAYKNVAACFAALAVSLLIPAAVTAQEAGGYSPAGLQISDIAVQGNQRIEPSTITSYLGINIGEAYSQYDVDSALKTLYATGFFADVKILPRPVDSGKVQLVVAVTENPIINRLAFEGNRSIDDDALEPELELRPRAIYTRTKIQKDVKRVLDLYRRKGYFSASVEPKVIQLDQNRIDLVFEIQEGTVAKIQKIMFIGNKSYSSRTLTKAIKSEESMWYKFLSDDDKYDPDRVLYDQELLRRFYTSNGYADFQVKSSIAELTPSRDAFYLTFTVEEGEQYNFGKIDLQSALKGVDPEALKTQLTTVPSETFNSSEVESSIDALTKSLGDQGYAFVEISPDLNRDPKTKIIDLNYKIKEGPRVYVERININGNVRTLDEVIRREFRIAEGDPYSTSKLARTEQRLNNLGFFEKVEIKTQPGSTPDKTVIDVSVQEKSTGEISLGAGFSTVDGALADIGVRETNLLGRGQDLRFKALLAAERQQFDVGFTEPYFLDREMPAGFDLFKTRQDLRDESSFDRDTNGGRLRLGYALTEKVTHSLNYTYRKTDIRNVAINASRYVKEQEGTTTNSSVGHSITYEDRDNKFEPTRGSFLMFSQEFAGIGGDTNYLEHEIKAGAYYSVAPKWVLQFMGSGGHVLGLSGDDVRIQDRFFVGGKDLRGFDNAGIGPRDINTKDALGGNMYYTLTSEVHFPLGLPDDLGFTGAFFVDAGSLWDVDATGADIMDNGKLRVSAGFGLAWASPFGPIRIDFAHALVKDDLDETQLVHFNFGTRF